MQITDMLNQYNRTLASGTEISSGTQGIRQLASALQQMSVGNVFEGSINHLENGVATLGLPDGKTIQARLENGVSVRVGESMFFQVRSNNGMQIAIRPFSQAGGLNPALLNALKAASLPADGRMVTMVNRMMEQSMPIDKQSLVQMAKLVAGNGRMDVSDIVQMTKLGIPVTEEMAAQFENYKSDQYAILDRLEAVMEAIPESLAGEGQSLKELLDFNRQMLNVLLGEAQTADGSVTVRGGQAEGSAQAGIGADVQAAQSGKELPGEQGAAGKTLAGEAVQSGKDVSGEQGAVGKALAGEEVQSGKDVSGEQGAAGKALAGEQAAQLGEELFGEQGAVGKALAGEQLIQAGEELSGEQGTAGRILAGEQGAAGKALAGEQLAQPGKELSGEQSAQAGKAAGEQTTQFGGGLAGSEKSAVQNPQTDTLKNLFTGEGLQRLSGQLAKIPELSQNPSVFQEGMLSVDLTSKELLHLLSQAFSSRNPFSRQALSGLASSKEYRTLIRSVMEQQWLLRPEELKGEHKVSELYERLDRQMAQLEKVLKAFGQSTPQLSDTAASVRSNIQFMNQLNQTYAYIQIPLKLAGQNAHSDLYVYTDKRKKREKGDELTAFLHLDLDHLGSTDVSIKLRSRQVSTNFYLADDISYRLLSEHIELLEQRLSEKGYQAKIHITNQEEKVNFVEDILKQGTPSAGGMVHRYSFDVRA